MGLISLYKIDNLLTKLFKKDYYFLISTGVYHIQLIIFGLLGLIPSWYNYHTFFPLYFDSASLSAPFLSYEIGNNFDTYFYTSIILICDFVFLFIIRHEINVQQEKYNVKYWYYPSKIHIILIECIILYLSVGNPIMREILYFMSFNTIQVFLIYRVVMRYIPFMNKLFLLGGYLYIIMLTIAPIREVLYLIWIIH